MTEAYSIASKLTFSTNGPQIVADLIRAFDRLDTVVGSTQGNVGKLTAELRALSGGARGIGATVKALEGMEKVRLAPGLLGDLEKVTTATREFATIQKELARSAAETALAYREMGRSPPRGPAGPGAPRPPRGAHPAPAGGMSHHDLLNTSMGLTMAGDAGMGFFGSAIKAEMEVSQQLAALRFNKGVTEKDVADARALAERITKDTPGTTLAENLHTLTEAYTVMGDLHEAMSGAPSMARLAYILKNLPGAHHGDGAFAGAQAIEVMQKLYDPKTGQTDMAAFNQQLAAMTQVAVGTGGRAGPESYLALAKQARVGGMVANDALMYRDAPAMMIALGGSRAGTGMAATFQQMITGRMTENAANQLKKAGLLDKSAVWHGGQVRDMQKHLQGYSTFGANPVEWVRQFMLSDTGALARNHIDPKDKLAVAKFLSDWSGRQTGLGFMAEMTLGMGGIDKERGKIANTTTDPMATLQQFDPMQKIREFHAAENELLVTLGKDAMGPALEALKGLTNVIRELAAWGKANPDAAKNLTIVGGALSILATGAGQAAMVIYLGAPLLGGLSSLARVMMPFGAGGAANGALATLAGGGLGSLAALGAAAIALPPLLKMAADALGVSNPAGAGHGGKGLAPHGYVSPGGGQGAGNGLGDWLNQKWDEFKNAPSSAGPHPRDLRHPSSYLAPGGGQQPVFNIKLHATVDGRELIHLVSAGLMQRTFPSQGTTGYDPRTGVGGGLAGAGAGI